MMYNYMFFAYLAAEIMFFFVVASVTVFFKQDGKITKAQRCLRSVAASYFVVVYIYITIDYYRLMIIHEPSVNFIYRILDITSWLFSKYFWYVFILECSTVKTRTKRKAKIFIQAIMFPLIAVSAFNYGYFMDGFYYVNDIKEQKFILDVQALTVFIIVLFTIAGCIFAYNWCYYVKIRKLIYMMSTVLLCNSIWNGFVTIMLINGYVKYVDWITLEDPTAFLLVIVSFLLMLTVKIYFDIETENIVPSEKICRISEKYSLTKREEEIAIYLYKGFTYAAIADELYISQHTVKRHVHNIYAKLNINSRKEFLELIKQ